MSDSERLFEDGAAYERLMGRWSQRVGEPFLDWLALPPGLQWLDVGCGNGAFTEVVIRRSKPAAIAGIDPSTEQIAYARTRPGTKMASFQVADAQSLPFTSHSFDVAAMALVISFIPDPLKAVAEMARVVRPGGTFATYMWDFAGGGAPVNPIYLASKSMGLTAPLPPGAAMSSREALQDAWASVGADAIETSVISIRIEHESFEAFWDANSLPIGPLGVMIQKLSDGQRLRLREHLREHLPVTADGRVVYNSFANAVKGRAGA
jgi:ubiquinone/menaquinone biosynthesis C-methylase UbiE